MPPEKTEQYSIPPMIEHLANAAGLNAQMLRETRDYLADSLNRNQQLALENAGLKKDVARLQRQLDEVLAVPQ